MLSSLLVLLLSVATSLAGSLCPPKANIYPCLCMNLPKKANLYITIVHCHRLGDSDSLKKIFPVLSELKIDRFNLYDSFWEAHKRSDQSKMHLPEDWIFKLRSKEIEIVDTTLSKNFACQNRDCNNIDTTRFIISNSTSSENLQLTCDFNDVRRDNSYHWISCMIHLEELELSYGKLNALGTDFLPIEMKRLTKINLSHNLISTVHKKAFSKVSALKILDLSHNRLISLDSFFEVKMGLKTLDVSFNQIRTLDESFFSFLPKLQNFFLKSNKIVNLEKNHWSLRPSQIRIIDLTDNPLHCHCNIKWMGGTLPNKLSLVGRCHTPKEYNGNYLKKRISHLAKACDEEGNIRKLTTPSNV